MKIKTDPQSPNIQAFLSIGKSSLITTVTQTSKIKEKKGKKEVTCQKHFIPDKGTLVK